MRWKEVRAGTRTVWGILVSMALLATSAPLEVGAEASQPSYVDNRLYLHYNMTRKEGWMNTNPNETDDTGWRNIYGLFQETDCLLRFPLKPCLNGTLPLVLNISRPWLIGVRLLSDRPTDVTGCLLIDGDYSCTKQMISNATGWFYMELDVGREFVDCRWNITFNITFKMHRGDFIAPYYELKTDGNSNIAVPILAPGPDTDDDGMPDVIDPDDDNDGHNDTVDAYPLDLTRWTKPETAHPTPLWLYASPLPAILAIIVGAVLWRRRKRLRSAEPPHK